MSGSLNKVMIIGNLGRDPEIRSTPSGAKVSNFSVATNESYTDKSGQKVERTEWHRIVMWRGLADIAEKYLRKGSTVYVEGKLQTRSWDDQNGQRRYTTEIIADQMTMLGGRAREGQGMQENYPVDNPPNTPSQEYPPGGSGRYSQAGSNTPAAGPGTMPPAPEDDLPF
ncbi:single-stranded DNA-binding protein [Fibrobacterota bacterium]